MNKEINENVYLEKDNDVRKKELEDLEYALVKSMVLLRKGKKITQQNLATQSGVIRETIARIENMVVSPQINTVNKVLYPLGYTLKIVPIKDDEIGEDSLSLERNADVSVDMNLDNMRVNTKIRTVSTLNSD